MRVDSARPGYGPRSVAAQNRTAGFPSRSSGTSRRPGAGARCSSSAAARERGPRPSWSASTRSSTAHSSPRSPSVRSAAAAISWSSSFRTRRMSLGAAGWCARSSRWRAVTRRHLPHSVRGFDSTRWMSRRAVRLRSGLMPRRRRRSYFVRPTTIVTERTTHDVTEITSRSTPSWRTTSFTLWSSSPPDERTSLERGIHNSAWFRLDKGCAIRAPGSHVSRTIAEDADERT